MITDMMLVSKQSPEGLATEAEGERGQEVRFPVIGIRNVREWRIERVGGAGERWCGGELVEVWGDE